MSTGRDEGSGGLDWTQNRPFVIHDSDKENISVLTKTPSRHNTGATLKPNSSLKRPLANMEGDQNASEKMDQLRSALRRAKEEAEMYKSDRQQVITAFKKQTLQVKALQDSATAERDDKMLLVKLHEEKAKKLELLRITNDHQTNETYAAVDDPAAADLDRLKGSVESLEIRNNLLREDRDSKTLLLAKRESTCANLREELDAAKRREEELQMDLVTLRAEVEVARTKSKSVADAEAAWEMEKVELSAQVQDLEAQVRVAASSSAESHAAHDSAKRRVHELDQKVVALQDDLTSLHRKSTTDLRDWRQRYQEAVASRKAVEARFSRTRDAEATLTLVSERQSQLDKALHEAYDLLLKRFRSRGEAIAGGCITCAREGSSQGIVLDQGKGDLSTPTVVSTVVPGAGRAGRVDWDPPQFATMAVEGVLEQVLGGVFQAVLPAGGKPHMCHSPSKRQEVELELGGEAVAILSATLGKLETEMETLREYGVTEATAYLEEAKELKSELREVQESHRAVLSDLGKERRSSERKVADLLRQLNDEEMGRRQLEATVQLTEMALAAKVSAEADGGRREEEERRVARLEQVHCQEKC
ncbi:unnamed protein product [Choristocarpus tenellus]